MNLIKGIFFQIVILLILKLLVSSGILAKTDSAKPVSLNIDWGSKTLNATVNGPEKKIYDFKIVGEKALIGKKLVADGDIVEITGDEYIVDIKIDHVELEEYKLFQKVVKNFQRLNEHPIFSWTFYIRSLIFIVFFFAYLRIDYAILNTIIKIPIFAFLSFYIVNVLAWTGVWGYLFFLSIILIDVFIGIAMASDE